MYEHHKAAMMGCIWTWVVKVLYGNIQEQSLADGLVDTLTHIEHLLSLT